MKKNRLVSIIEKLATRTHSQRQTPRARSARVEQLEARELLSVARGYDFLALDDANVAGFIGGGFSVDEANAAYHASVSSRVDDVVDITETMLEDVETGVSGPGKPSEYYDADKSKKNTEDDLLCWAATASNMLWYTDWASVKGSANEQEFFDSVFVGTWPDSGDQTLTGCAWYLNAEYLSIYQSGTVRNDSSATAIDGGGVYASLFATYGESAQDYLSARPVRGVDDLTEIASNLRAGYGVGLGVDCDGSSGHAVTCWGYAVNSNLSPTDPGYYTGLYITDSDDEKSGKNDDLLNDRKLIYLDLTWDSTVQTFYGTGSYRITDRTSYYPSDADSYYIDDATFLAPRPAKYAASTTEKETPSTIVTTESDVVNAYDGLISLREAISYANEGGTITFKNTLRGKTIALDSARGQLYIAKSLTIDASNLYNATTNAPGITISGADATRIMWVAADNTLALKGLEFTHGKSPACGGAIWNYGNLTVENCLFKDNNATYVNDEGGTGNYYGGAIAVKPGGKIAATSTTFTGNVGGGVVSFQTDLASTFTDCVFQNNESYSLYAATGDVAATNCDVIGNNSYGLYAWDGAITATNCRIKENSQTGIYTYQSAITATNCEISDNGSYGIYAYQGEVAATECEISGNSYGLYAYQGAITATNCEISDNGNYGIYTSIGEITATDCEISGNNCGLYTNQGAITATNCVVEGNAKQGLYAYKGEIAATNLVIRNNKSQGIYCSAEGTINATNCLVVGNTASYGAGLELFGTANLYNCTITGNVASSLGGGVDLDGNAVLNAYNTIIVGNSASNGADLYIYSANAAANGDNTLSSFTGWASGSNNLTYVESNPLFTDAANGDYSLAENSQAIDKGANSHVAVAEDLDGNARIVNGIVDLGAYERQLDFNPVVLDVPSNLRETAKTETSITVAWNAVENASGYTLSYKKSTDSVYTTIKLNGASSTSYTLTSLHHSATYNWRVRAEGNGTEYVTSAYSAARSAKPRQKLDAPNATQAATSATSITVSWNAVANASGYKLLYKKSTDTAYSTISFGASVTKYQLTGLVAGASYDLKMMTVGDGFNYSNSAYSVPTPEPNQQVLPTPANPRETAKTETTITVAWDPVENASQYGLIYKKTTDSAYTVVKLTPETTSYKLTGLDNTATYSWRVRAIGDEIYYITSAYTATRTVKPRQKLATPTNEAYAATANSITATWNLVPNASAYRIMYKPTGGSYVTVDVDDPTATSYKIAGLAKNASYALKIAAIGDGFDYSSSAYTTLTTVTTEDALITLDTPANPRETAKTETSITVAWDPVENVKQYGLIYKKTTDSAYTTIKLAPETTSYKLTGLDGSATYYWRVRAIGDGDSYLTSAYTATRSVKPRQKLATPANEAYQATANSITATWNLVPNASSYRIMYKQAGGSYVTVDVDDPTATSHTISGLTKDASYAIKIAAIGDGFDYSSSAYTALTTVTTEGVPTPLATPANPRETAKTETSISVEWDPVENVTQYGLIYKKTTDSAYTTIKLDPETTSYKLAGLDGSATYYWRVRAIGDGDSYLTSAYTATRSVKPRQKLATPANEEYAASANSITATWDLVPNASAYRIMYKPSGGSYVTVDVDDPTATSYTISGLTKNVSYVLKIAAIGDGFDYSSSAYTALTAVTTEGGPTTLKTPTVTLASTASTVTVNWNAVPNAKSYVVLFDGTEYGAATPGYKFSFQTPKQSHTIQVRAIGDGTNYLNSAYSTAKSISTTSLDALNAPTPRVQNITASSISVSWSAINGAAGYQIAYAPASGSEGGYVVATLGAGTTSYVFTGLAPSKDFIISVRTLGDGLETTSSEYEKFLFASTVDTTSALAMDEEWFQEEEWFEELDDNFDLLAENLLNA